MTPLEQQFLNQLAKKLLNHTATALDGATGDDGKPISRVSFSFGEAGPTVTVDWGPVETLPSQVIEGGKTEEQHE